MKGLAEAALFLGLAAMLHAAAFWAWRGEGSRAAAGEGGEASLTLAGANAATDALIEAWERAPAMAPPSGARPPRLAAASPSPATRPEAPPKAISAPGVMAAPERPEAPDMSASADKADEPEPLRAADAPARAGDDDADLHREPPPSSPAPRARPKRPRQPVKTAMLDPAPPAIHEQRRSRGADAQPRERAAGSGGGAEAGAETAAELAGDGETAARLSEIWGGAIRREIERKKRYPRHVRRSGAALVAMTVERNGMLASARIARSSGSKGLDEAAITAVKAAAPYDPAPAALRGGRFQFVLQINFRR
ncbi:TonB family protein [Pikeienuella sp. HZG-20]|uniref:TonB family protein n=1 Tax=Paludibacillus litoralis TaxID=3133267 RepID=UPI0030EB1A1A